MPIKDYSTTPASNNSNPPNGFPELMAPSGYNDSGRQLMADIRADYENREWLDFGHAHVFASSTSTTIAGVDLTAVYPVGRRVRAVGSTTGTIYGVVASSSFSTNSTITYTWDSGSLQNESLAISVGHLPTNQSINVAGVSGAASTVTTTRGDLIARGASADERLAVGTIDQILSSDGTDPVWIDDPSVVVDLGTTDLAGGDDYELTLSAAYRKFEIIIEDFRPTTDAGTLLVTLSDGAYKTSGYGYTLTRNNGGSVSGLASSSATAINLTDTSVGNLAADILQGKIEVFGHQSGQQCEVLWHLSGHNGTTEYDITGGGRYRTDDTITALKLAMAAGASEMANGRISVYGFKA